MRAVRAGPHRELIIEALHAEPGQKTEVLQSAVLHHVLLLPCLAYFIDLCLESTLLKSSLSQEISRSEVVTVHAIFQADCCV